LHEKRLRRVCTQYIPPPRTLHFFPRRCSSRWAIIFHHYYFRNRTEHRYHYNHSDNNVLFSTHCF